MNSLSTFEVIISNQNGSCQPGEYLKGEVIVENHHPVKLKEIRLECSGLAYVHWVDTRNVEGAIEPESAEEQYYNICKVLFPESPAQDQQYCWLQPGSHSFSFEFPIPPKLPCSFEGPFGHVRYWLKAVIEKPWKLKVNVRPFTITPKLDLNIVPHCSEEIVKSKTFQLSGFLHSTGSFFASIHLPKKGFVLGEEVPVNIYIKNESCQSLRSTSIALKMILHYETPNQSRHSKRKLNKIKTGKVLAGEVFYKSVNGLRIPKDLPPNLNGCGLINVRYAIILKIEPSIFSLSALKIPVEIIIGTIPLQSLTDRQSTSNDPPSYGEVMRDNDLPRYQDIIVH